MAKVEEKVAITSPQSTELISNKTVDKARSTSLDGTISPKPTDVIVYMVKSGERGGTESCQVTGVIVPGDWGHRAR